MKILYSVTLDGFITFSEGYTNCEIRVKMKTCGCTSLVSIHFVIYSQVTFIYIALLTIQIVSKHLTVSNWRIESQ